ncbi:ATP synthase F0 subunit C [Candidatus Saganbacteria bacterium]|nr:ATP synthase F0 subunit C [Candidatus Saganbacteria bacterium]
MLAHFAAGMTIGLVGLGATLGMAWIAAKAVEGMARQPEATANIRLTMIIAIAFVESIALYALLVSFLLLAK